MIKLLKTLAVYSIISSAIFSIGCSKNYLGVNKSIEGIVLNDGRTENFGYFVEIKDKRGKVVRLERTKGNADFTLYELDERIKAGDSVNATYRHFPDDNYNVIQSIEKKE